MRQLLVSLSATDRLQAAAGFLSSFSGQESLCVSPSRIAADELLRTICVGRGSVFGIHRLTLPQLAIEAATTRLAKAGKTVLAGVALDALAARAVYTCKKRSELKWFEPVAYTPGFFRALVSTITEIRLNNLDLERLRASGSAGHDLASLARQYDSDLEEAKLADLATILEVAVIAVKAGEFAKSRLPILFHGIAPASHREREFIKALVGQASEAIAIAHSRDEDSIAAFREALNVEPIPVRVPKTDTAIERLRSYVFRTETPPSGALDETVSFISATDESRECVEIARSILRAAESGVPFDKMAVLLRNPDLYQPLIEEALRRAEVPAFYTGGTKRPNPAGRALLALLACAGERLSATRFSEYLSLGQIPEVVTEQRWVPPQGELFPVEMAIQDAQETLRPDPQSADVVRAPRQWERLLVDAAVIGGHDRWIRRLEGLRNELQKRILELGADDEAAFERLERELRQLETLQKFALPIVAFLDGLPSSATWGDWLAHLEELAILALRRPEGVLSVLAELRPMAGIGPVTLDEVQDALADRLRFLRTEPTERRYGKVFVATVSEVSGMAFEAIFLPGLGEDIFPKKSFEDPLLLDAIRAEVSPFLATQETRFAHERLLLHTGAGAVVSRLYVSYPRMDLRQGRARGPSFYALDILRAITGRIPELRELQRSAAEASQSQIGWPAPRDPNSAIDNGEFDLAVISHAVRDPQKTEGYGRYLMEVSPPLARSLRARWSRWERRWSPSDGLILNPNDPSIAALSRSRLSSRPYSATALQYFAACPYRFLLNSIYRLQPREERVALERMDALTRGSLFHSVQFRLFSRLQSMDLLPITANNYTTIYPIADEVLSEVAELYREETAPAIPRIWEGEVEEVRWDVRGWIRHVAQFPDASDWTPVRFELAFGLRDRAECDPHSQTEPVVLEAGPVLRGSIDLIEERAGNVRVTDHKTGRSPTKRIEYLGGGEILQPLLYAKVAEALLGKKVDSTRLFYCTERGQFRMIDIPLNEDSTAALITAFKTIDQSIGSGFLPAAPRQGACQYCDYRLVCGPYEEFRVQRKPKQQLNSLTVLRATL
jgi:ATP-dependent helicase/DNAse subunit B